MGLGDFFKPDVKWEDLRWVTVHVQERGGELQVLQQGYWGGIERGPWPMNAYRWVPVDELNFRSKAKEGGD